MSSTALKIIALVLMLLDHIAMFIPGMPEWFRYLGRGAAPIFMFCLVEGFIHTSDRIKYLKRLYIGSAVMAVMSTATAIICPDAVVPLENNFFSTLFLIGLVITIVEKRKSKDRDTNQLLVAAVIMQVVSIVVCYVVEAMAMAIDAEGVEVSFGLFVRENASHLVNGLMPNILFCEGGYLIILFGFMMYYYHGKKSMPMVYAYMCAVYALIVIVTGGGVPALLNDYQWMMIIATPFFMAYNGQKGSGLKYLFYVFYPVHCLALFLIGYAMQ